MKNSLPEGNDPSTLGKYGIKPEHMARARALVNSGHAPDVAAKMIKKKFAYPGFTGLEKIKVDEEQLDELSPGLIKAARDKRYAQLSSQAAASTGTLSQHEKPTPATVSKYWDSEGRNARQAKVGAGQTYPNTSGTGAHRQMSYAKGDLSDPNTIARNKQRDMNRGKMLGVAQRKLAGTANVPAKQVGEGKKVDRMVGHIKKSEEKAGKSKDEAENIAWATANKRGMLDNKNKKTVKESHSVNNKAYEQGKEAKERGYERNSPYKKLVAEKYWLAGYDGKPKPKAVKEGDIPSSAGVDTRGAGLGAGRSKTTLESETSKTEYRVSGTYDAKTSKGYDTRPVSVKVNASSEREAKELAKKQLANSHKNYKATKVEALTKKVEEGKKPDFLDLDKDGNKKEPMKKAVVDKKKSGIKETEKKNSLNKQVYDAINGPLTPLERTAGDRYEKLLAYKKKKGIKESMNHRISAARFEGKSHGLKGHAHCGKQYEDLEERKAYCEGYKDGLDECYGMGVYETSMPPATVSGMADQDLIDEVSLMDDEMEEGNAFTGALARTPKGGKFSLGGRSYTDTSNLDEYAFESWDRQLNTLLNEGINVSVSKGNENVPDTVSISATDTDAEQLLSLVKNAGLGLFGADEEVVPSMAMSMQPEGEPEEIGTGGMDIGVVDGSDSMMGMLQKLSGIQGSSTDSDDDFSDEDGDSEQLYGNSDEHDHDEGSEEETDETEEETNEETCNECGEMMEANHQCKNMAEETDAEADEETGAEEDKALAGADSEKEEEIDESMESLLEKLTRISEGKAKKPKKSEDTEEDDEENEAHTSLGAAGSKTKKFGKEKVDEWANQVGMGPGKGTDAKFEQDTEFMTKTIAGGLNKPKTTGQTTSPIITAQMDRTFDSLNDLSKLAGIKK